MLFLPPLPCMVKRPVFLPLLSMLFTLSSLGLSPGVLMLDVLLCLLAERSTLKLHIVIARPSTKVSCFIFLFPAIDFCFD